MSSGRSRMNSSTITKVTTPAAATTNVALRHPLDSSDLRERRQKYQLAGRVGGGERAQHEAAPFVEPARGDDGGEDHGGDAGAGADEHAPEQHQLPLRVHARRKRDRGDEQRNRGEHDPPQPEAIHDRGGERTDQTEERDVDRDRERDDCAVPPEFLLERHDEHAWCCADARRHQQHDKRRLPRSPRRSGRVIPEWR